MYIYTHDAETRTISRMRVKVSNNNKKQIEPNGNVQQAPLVVIIRYVALALHCAQAERSAAAVFLKTIGQTQIYFAAQPQRFFLILVVFVVIFALL